MGFWSRPKADNLKGMVSVTDKVVWDALGTMDKNTANKYFDDDLKSSADAVQWLNEHNIPTK